MVTKASGRALRFTELLGEELRAAIIENGFTPRQVAFSIGQNNDVTIYSYLNGKRVIPVTLLVDICEVIGADGAVILRQAYVRLVEELGPPPLKPE